MKKKILIVEDEWNMRNLLRIYLEKDYQLLEAEDGRQAFDVLSSAHVDLIILDVMLPELDGWEICKEIRKKRQTPILMLSARNEIMDKVCGLEIGADDYLGKPFEPCELSARIKALFRRSLINEHYAENVMVFGEQLLTIKTDSRTVLVKGRKAELTPKEYDLLYFLASQPQRVFTREMLLEVIWGFQDHRDLRAVDSHIKNIRLKTKELTSDYNPIQTVWGVGYKFNAADGSL
ncbi:response regulator transcription factor [Peribacillus kribbensis]|uniref:response regulator transcription factor n=1 Tax=Peribacillus kribbensis TaxID=356658 RepID=UPI000415588B|nr:response regulator transcription factor [Peribacillus kribbensis]